MAKLPAFQFYPGDWIKDPNLKVCSIFARGLLVDLLCAMHEAKHRGVLSYPDGVTPLSNEQIVGMSCGSTEAEKLAALVELETHEVLKRDANGCLYSSRMVRDEQIRAARAAAGALGGSKTQASGQAKHKQTVKQKPPPSSSSSSSISSSDVNTLSAGKPPRPPNVIWDCVVALFFNGQDAAPHKSRIGKVVRDLKALGATPDEIRTRTDNYRANWPNAAATPEALVKHWQSHGTREQPAGTPGRVYAAPGKYAHLDPPPQPVVNPPPNLDAGHRP